MFHVHVSYVNQVLLDSLAKMNGPSQVSSLIVSVLETERKKIIFKFKI